MRSIEVPPHRRLLNAYEPLKQHSLLRGWLPDDFDQSFVICVGAGPWTINRRFEVQRQALEWLAGNDGSLAAVGERQLSISCYPLQWQNTLVENMARYLHEGGWTMTTFGLALRGLASYDRWAEALDLLHFAANHGRRTKVVSLYARDFLLIPAFPVDRHVRRILQANDLPTREGELVSLCMRHQLNPCSISRAFFYGSVEKANPQH